MLGPSYRDMQKPPYPQVDFRKHAADTMLAKLICSQSDFAISLVHNEPCVKSMLKNTRQQAWGRLFVRTDENLQVRTTFLPFCSMGTMPGMQLVTPSRLRCASTEHRVFQFSKLKCH